MDLAQLSRLIENLIRVGTIHEVNHDQKLCRVTSGGLTTGWLPWFSLRAGTTKDWDPPTQGEQCIILSPSGEVAAGVVLAGLYSNAFNAPSSNPDECLREYPDGARISYNHATGALNAVGIKTALVEAATSIMIDCPQVTFTGKVNIQDLLTYENGMVGYAGENTGANITGDVTADGISLVHHLHTGVVAGGSNTGQPV
jgi:phage baseplate assembly protein V